MKRFLMLIPLACLATTSVQAHAFLDSAVPLVGSTVHAAPATISLTFTEAVEPSFSAIKLFAADGREIALGTDAWPSKPARTLVMGVPAALPPGHYEVRWNVVAVDTHRTNGHFTFDYTP